MINTYLPQILIFLGLVLTFLGGFISFIRDDSTQKENKELAVENKKLIESNINLSNVINNNIIGGDSYGIISPAGIQDKGKKIYCFYFNNVGDFPMSDIDINYFDQDQVERNKEPLLSTDSLKDYHFQKIGNVPAKTGRLFGEYFEINENQHKRIAFTVTAKNGSFIQQLQIIMKDGKLLIAKQIKSIGVNSKILFEEIPKDFPKKVDWK